MEKKKTTARPRAQDYAEREHAVPAFNEFLGELIVEFGGPNALAREYVDSYNKAKPGSATRTQILMKISELLLRNTQHFGTPRKVEELSDEEIFAVLQRSFGAARNGDLNPAEPDAGRPGGTERPAAGPPE